MELLQVKNNRVRGASGIPIRLRGVCIGGWMNMENFINGYPGVEHGIRAALTEVLGRDKKTFFFDRWLDYFFAEEDAAFSLIQSLEGGVRTQAVIADRSLGDIVAGPGREASLQRYEGVSLAQLNEAQQGGIMRILELYAGTMREEIATAAMAKVREAGLDALHFAWAGSLVRGRPHYFRVQGPAALIEYDNTQDGANHVHSVWIDPRDLFGRDLLLTHYRGAH